MRQLAPYPDSEGQVPRLSLGLMRESSFFSCCDYSVFSSIVPKVYGVFERRYAVTCVKWMIKGLFIVFIQEYRCSCH